MINILERIKIGNILEEEFDKRLTDIGHLTVVQLREECAIRNLRSKGNKSELCERLYQVIGQNTKVFIVKNSCEAHTFPKKYQTLM